MQIRVFVKVRKVAETRMMSRVPANTARALKDALSFLASYGYELAAFFIPFAIFVASISSEPGAWDTAEMQGVPYILGIAHPTGFPFYTLAGYAFTHVFLIGTIAFRLNLFAAICVGAACVAAYLTAREFAVPKLCAVAGAAWFAVTGIVWTHAIRAEAHDLALALSTLAVLLWIRWQKSGNERVFIWACASLGLSAATHPLAVWLIPGAIFASLVKRPNARTLARGALIITAALALYLYLPLRSAIVTFEHLDPTLGLAGIHGGIFWNYNNPSTWHGLIAELSGSQFGAGGTLMSAINVTTLQTYLWNWLTAVNTAYGAFGIVLAFIGLARMWSTDWKTTASLLLFTLAALPFSFAYANVEGDADRYRMLSLWLVPVLMGGAATFSVTAFELRGMLRATVVFAAMLLWSTETLFNNNAMFQNRTATGGRTLISAVAAHVPRGSVVVTSWLDATSLAYGAYVDHSLPDRTIVAGWPTEFTRYYRSWTASRSVYIIANVKPALPGIKLSPPIAIDAGHSAWRVQ